KITLAEGASIVLKLLGYTGSDFSGAYPTAQMSMYHSLGLDKGIFAKSSGDVLDRRDSMYLFYNLLSVKNKQGQYYLNTLGYSLNAAGEVDRVALMGQVMDGPVVAQDGWQAQIPFDLSKVSVTRTGRPSTLESIQSSDVVYWNEGMRRLWVYTDRVTGTIQALAPSAASPTSVTVAGRTYSLETDQAAYAVSDFGPFRLGDTVTLLLGRTGGVAAVVAPNAGEQNKVGIVTALSKGSYSGSNGSSYTADTVTLQATDGKTYSYQWTTDYFSVGALVQVVVSGDGEVTLKRLQEQEFEGKVSADGQSAGKYPFADDVEIMDTYENVGIRVFPSRLAGVYLDEDMVRYYTLNPQGEIQRLILDEATGDMHQYGVMTNIQDMSGYMNVLVNYEMDFGGNEVACTSQTKSPVKEGGFVLKGELADPEMIESLKYSTVDRVEGNVLVCGSMSYTVFDHTLVYEYRDGEYYLSYLDRVDDGEHKLTAWYDKAPGEGGSVRVIIAK
ncbi:MAG: S-layer homology domain-containing protein, partial [Oscillibacter sp.]|nr:S-layer homology domain-containing protein [Oscillibacter sp.]